MPATPTSCPLPNAAHDLTGQIALVTGASSGLGHRFARVLAASGATVAVAARRTDKLDALVDTITAAGGKAAAFALDVTQDAQFAPLFDAIATRLGAAPSILVNNAGIPDAQRAHRMSVELVDAVIERLERVEPQLNAVAERLYDMARGAALEPRVREGLFAGVPTLIKDLFTPVQGAAMTNGSQALGGFRADFEAEHVSRIRRAGCVILGTSTSPEFGTSYSTESNRFGATRNPWNIGHSAGGSSGGAAALVGPDVGGDGRGVFASVADVHAGARGYPRRGRPRS